MTKLCILFLGFILSISSVNLISSEESEIVVDFESNTVLDEEVQEEVVLPQLQPPVPVSVSLIEFRPFIRPKSDDCSYYDNIFVPPDQTFHYCSCS